MKTIFSALFVILSLTASSQESYTDTGIIGTYHTTKGPSFTFQITQQDKKFRLNIVGQGTVDLIPLSGLSFEPKYVRPRARMEFKMNEKGEIDRLHWSQGNQTYAWKRTKGD